VTKDTVLLSFTILTHSLISSITRQPAKLTMCLRFLVSFNCSDDLYLVKYTGLTKGCLKDCKRLQQSNKFVSFQFPRFFDISYSGSFKLILIGALKTFIYFSSKNIKIMQEGKKAKTAEIVVKLGGHPPNN